MAKIKFNKWKESVQFEKLAFGYRIEVVDWWRTSVSFGRNKGEIKCPCCDAVTGIYIWSFFGSGKRCSNCNVKLRPSGAIVKNTEVTGDVSINDSHIFKRQN